MFKEISKRETLDLLTTAGTFSSDSFTYMNLSLYPKYYRILTAFQYTYNTGFDDYSSVLRNAQLPSLPNNSKATVVFEMTQNCSMEQLDSIREWAFARFGEALLERFEPVFHYDQAFPARITVVIHSAKARRRFHSSINQRHRYQKELDLRIAETLDGELTRNEENGASIAVGADEVSDMLFERHFLWTGITNSNNSFSDVFKRLRREMEGIQQDYDVSGLVLFIEVDRSFTTMGEVSHLKQLFTDFVGEGVEVAVNVRVRDSFIKSITCRAALIGSPKYIKGEVFEDYGRYEILLFESENKERGHVIVASYEEEEFALSRYDWGEFDRNKSGETDDHHYFDKENTLKLFTALHVRKPEALLHTIRRRFASRIPCSADSLFLAFCRKEGIQFKSDYHF